METKIDTEAKDIEKNVLESGDLVQKGFLESLGGAKIAVLKDGGFGRHNIQIALEKDAREFTSKEVEVQVKRYAKSMAEDSFRFMRESDKGIYDGVRTAFKDDLKEELIRKDGYVVGWMKGEGEKAAYKEIPAGGPFGGGVIKEDLKSFTREDAKAEELAERKIEECFAEHYREATKAAFRVAKDSANAEGKRIEISFADAYKTVTGKMRDDAFKIVSKEEKAARKAAKVARNDADRAMQGMEKKAETGAKKVETDFTMTIDEG